MQIRFSLTFHKRTSLHLQWDLRNSNLQVTVHEKQSVAEQVPVSKSVICCRCTQEARFELHSSLSFAHEQLNSELWEFSSLPFTAL